MRELYHLSMYHLLSSIEILGIYEITPCLLPLSRDAQIAHYSHSKLVTLAA